MTQTDMSNKLESNAIGQPLPSTALRKPSAQPGAGVTSVGTVKAWKKTERTILCHVTYPACALALFSIAGGVSFGLAGMLTMPILAAVAIGGTASAVVLLVSGLICLLTDLRLLSSLQENSGASTDRGLDIQRRSEAHRTSRMMEGAVISVKPVEAENLKLTSPQEITMEVDSQNLQVQHYKLVNAYNAVPSYDEELKQLRHATNEGKGCIVTLANQMTTQLSEIQGLVENSQLYKDLTAKMSEGVTKERENLKQISDGIQQSLTKLREEQEKLQKQQGELDEQREQFEVKKKELNEREVMLAEDKRSALVSMEIERLKQKAINDKNTLTIKNLTDKIKQKEAALTSIENLNDTLKTTMEIYKKMFDVYNGIKERSSAGGKNGSISSATSSRENSPLTLENNDVTVFNDSPDSDEEIDGRQILVEISSQNGENGALASSSNRTSGTLKGPTEEEEEKQTEGEGDHSQYITPLKNFPLLESNAKKVDVIEASNDSGPSQPSSQVPSFFGLF